MFDAEFGLDEQFRSAHVPFGGRLFGHDRNAGRFREPIVAEQRRERRSPGQLEWK